MKKKNKNILVFIALIIAAIVIGTGLFFATQKKQKDEPDATNSSIPENILDEGKKNSAERAEKESQMQNATSQGSVNIVDAAQYGDNVEVRANIDVIDNGGKCSFIFEKNGTTVNKQSDTLPNATNTVCSTLIIPVNELSPGIWNLEVTYTSTNYSGESNSVTVEVKT